jgi:hypothetical protein
MRVVKLLLCTMLIGAIFSLGFMYGANWVIDTYLNYNEKKMWIT